MRSLPRPRADFRGVSQPDVIIESLRPLKRKYARKVNRFFDPQQGGAQTLSVGTDARMVRLYDQRAAYEDKGAPQGSVRWEAQTRSDFLDRRGIKQVADLSVPALVHLATSLWDWSMCGFAVSHSQGVADRIDGLVRQRRVVPGEDTAPTRPDGRRGMGQDMDLGPQDRRGIPALEGAVGLHALDRHSAGTLQRWSQGRGPPRLADRTRGRHAANQTSGLDWAGLHAPGGCGFDWCVDTSIRRRRAGDLTACVALLGDVHEQYRYPIRWPTDPPTWLTPVDIAQAWVASVDDVLVGHVCLSRSEATSRLMLERLFVSPSLQGAGVGRALVSTATEWAIAHQYRLTLDVAENCEAAIALYGALGWTLVGRASIEWGGEVASHLLRFEGP